MSGDDAVQDLIEEVNGWASMNIDDEAVKVTQAEQIEKARAIASRYHRVFKQNPEGVEVLKDMMRKTLLRATVLPDDTQFAAGIREGRADMVRQILQNIEIAERE